MAEAGQNQTTIIGADTRIKGEMTFEHTARLLGQFEGKINAKGEFQVADSAACRASVEAGKVVVDGTVEGDVAATERVELNAKAKVKGDVKAARLIVADGASLVGHVTVGPEASKLGGPAATPPAVEAKPGQSRGGGGDGGSTDGKASDHKAAASR